MRGSNQPLRTTGIGLISLFLLMSLQACATLAPKPVFLSPPPEYLRDCTVPELLGTTNASLAHAYVDAKQSLVRCNEDKASIREWVSKASKAVK